MDILNVVLIIAIIVVALALVTFLAFQRKKDESVQELEQYERLQYSTGNLLKYVKKELSLHAAEDLYGLGLTESEFQRRKHRKEELKNALRNCNTGDLSSKIFVKEYIKDLLRRAKVNEANINYAIPFHRQNEMTSRIQFETLLHMYFKEYKYDALAQLFKKYELDKALEDGSFRVNAEQIRAIYKKEIRKLSFEDKLDILTQYIYSVYKGFGVVDEIRDMRIDGVSGGVSGLPKRMEAFEADNYLVDMLRESKNSLNSVWIMHKGKSIHLSFLAFENESELRRVTTNLYKYGYPGQLSETKPYIINEMYDTSRVTVVRSKLAESWAFFVRKKYDLKNLNMENLFSQKNTSKVTRFVEFLMKSNRITAITGMQGTGKTTFLMALIKFIHPALNLRIQETSFELNLRSLYPERNILSFQETDEISGQAGLDLQKKTDGQVNILGEVATDPVAAWFIQTSQVASDFTLITHHAKTTESLVYSLRNSLLKTAMFSNEAIAEQQVVSVLEFDIHLRLTHSGERYIERITEIVPIDHTVKMDDIAALTPTKNERESITGLSNLITTATVYFQQKTQRKQFEERNIIEFRDGAYMLVNRISESRLKDMKSIMGDEAFREFEDLMSQDWRAA